MSFVLDLLKGYSCIYYINLSDILIFLSNKKTDHDNILPTISVIDFWETDTDTDSGKNGVNWGNKCERPKAFQKI